MKKILFQFLSLSLKHIDDESLNHTAPPQHTVHVLNPFYSLSEWFSASFHKNTWWEQFDIRIYVFSLYLVAQLPRSQGPEPPAAGSPPRPGSFLEGRPAL